MNIVLADVDGGLIEAWNSIAGDNPHVSTYQGSIFEVECDALVSPANSFGENQLSPGLFGLSPLSTAHPLIFQHKWVRASS